MTAAVVVGLVLGFAGGRCAFRPRPRPPVGPGSIDLARYRLPDPPEPPPARPEPWRDLVPGAVELPLDLVHQFANPAERTAAARDVERIEHIQALIERDGITGAMCIRVDQHGRAVLEDGNHRLDVAHRLNVTSWPVEFKPSERITGWGRPVLKLVGGLAEALKLSHTGSDRSEADQHLG